MDWVIRLDCGAWRERRIKNTTSATAIVNNEIAMMNRASCESRGGLILATGKLGETMGAGARGCGVVAGGFTCGAMGAGAATTTGAGFGEAATGGGTGLDGGGTIIGAGGLTAIGAGGFITGAGVWTTFAGALMINECVTGGGEGTTGAGVETITGTGAFVLTVTSGLAVWGMETKPG
jgi:hypothetical protein